MAGRCMPWHEHGDQRTTLESAHLCHYVSSVDQTQAFSHAMQEFLSPELSRGSCISFLVLLSLIPS